MTDLLFARCANASACHGPGPQQPKFQGTNLYSTLTTRTVSRCGNSVLVKPGDPENSALIKVTTMKCGSLIMPSGPELSAEDEKTLVDWIQAGAPK